MSLESERRQAGMIGYRLKHPRTRRSRQSFELSQPLARVAAAGLVHRWEEAQQPRAFRLLEPIQKQRERQHTAGFWPLHWDKHPVSLAEIPNGPFSIDF